MYALIQISQFFNKMIDKKNSIGTVLYTMPNLFVLMNFRYFFKFRYM